MPGDIVKEINGIKLDSPSAGMQAIREQGASGSINLTVLRDEQEILLSLMLPSH